VERVGRIDDDQYWNLEGGGLYLAGSRGILREEEGSREYKQHVGMRMDKKNLGRPGRVMGVPRYWVSPTWRGRAYAKKESGENEGSTGKSLLGVNTGPNNCP